MRLIYNADRQRDIVQRILAAADEQSKLVTKGKPPTVDLIALKRLADMAGKPLRA